MLSRKQIEINISSAEEETGGMEDFLFLPFVLLLLFLSVELPAPLILVAVSTKHITCSKQKQSVCSLRLFTRRFYAGFGVTPVFTLTTDIKAFSLTQASVPNVAHENQV